MYSGGICVDRLDGHRRGTPFLRGRVRPGENNHRHRRGDEADVDESTCSSPGRVERPGRQGGVVGFRARPADRVDAARMEQELAEAWAAHHRLWLPLEG